MPLATHKNARISNKAKRGKSRSGASAKAESAPERGRANAGKTRVDNPVIRDRIKSLRRVRAGDLVAHPRNWRRHGEQQTAAIRAALSEIGFAGALLARETKKGLQLIDGHLRAGLDPDQRVPVLVLDVTAAEADKLLATFDPIAAMAEVDLEALSVLAGRIDFEVPELADLVAATLGKSGAAGREVVEDVPPDPHDGPCVAQVGDVWACGRHRVACGDSTDEATVADLLGDLRPVLMVTDPPYGVSYDPTWRSENRTGLVANDDRSDWREAYALFLGDVAYIWHASVHVIESAQSIDACGFERRAYLIWAKQAHTFGRGHYHWQHEPCWYAVRKGAKAQWIGDRKQSTLWKIDNVHPTLGTTDDGETVHGAQKPVECMARPIRNHDAPEVYDPFLGSGTTLIAAEQLGRSCYGIEIEPKYVDVILQRYMNFTDESPVRESDGARFADMVTEEAVSA